MSKVQCHLFFAKLSGLRQTGVAAGSADENASPATARAASTSAEEGREQEPGPGEDLRVLQGLLGASEAAKVLQRAMLGDAARHRPRRSVLRREMPPPSPANEASAGPTSRKRPAPSPRGTHCAARGSERPTGSSVSAGSGASSSSSFHVGQGLRVKKRRLLRSAASSRWRGREGREGNRGYDASLPATDLGAPSLAASRAASED